MQSYRLSTTKISLGSGRTKQNVSYPVQQRPSMKQMSTSNSSQHIKENTNTYKLLQNKITFLRDKQYPLLWRSDNRSINQLKMDLIAKGPNTDFAKHVELAGATTNYIAFGRSEYHGISFGIPTFNDHFFPTFHVITATQPSVIVKSHFMPKIQAHLDSNGNIKNIPYEVVGGVAVPSFGMVEGETAVPGKMPNKDVVGITTRIGMGSFSCVIPYDYDTVTFLNHDHSPSAVVTQILSANPEQAEQWERELKQMGKLDPTKRFIKPHETATYDFGRILPQEINSRRQLVITTIPADITSAMLPQYIADQLTKHEKETQKHVGIASILDIADDVNKKGIFVGASRINAFSLFGGKENAAVKTQETTSELTASQKRKTL